MVQKPILEDLSIVQRGPSSVDQIVDENAEFNSSKRKHDQFVHRKSISGQHRELVHGKTITTSNTTPNADRVNAQIELSNRVSLISQETSQWIEVFRSTIPTEQIVQSTPLLATYANRIAILTNDTGTVLLPGLCQVYFDDVLVGKSMFQLTDQGQETRIGLGIERNLWSRRELVERKINRRGANQLVTFKYLLVLVNTDTHPMNVQLLERLPSESPDNGIKVELSGADAARLSQDKIYARLQRPKGILRFDVTVPPRTTEKELLDVNYEFTIELAQSDQISILSSRDRIEDAAQLLDTVEGGVGGFSRGGFGGGAFESKFLSTQKEDYKGSIK